jgi:lactoylglutathione lyase
LTSDDVPSKLRVLIQREVFVEIVGSHHVALLTARFDLLRQFYGETLGLAEIGGYPERGIVFFRIGMIGIELIANDQAEPVQRGGWGHVALEVMDVDAAVAELEGRGVRFHVPPKDFPDDTPDARIAFFRDPDGNELQLVQRLTPRYPTPRSM